MEDPVSEVLYETVHHITRPFSANYPPQQVDVKRGLSSLLSFPGVNQLKLKWDEYRYPKFLKKWTSLFVSPRGEHVAVASGNQITFLHKRETYKEISGVFTCENRHAIFTHGAWSESHDVLGVVDDAHTLYFLKANGEEIKRITKSTLKVSVPIVGLIVQGDPDGKASYLCSFILLTSDGTLHHIEVGQKTQSRVSSMLTPNNHLAPKKQFYRSVLGVDYHPEFSLLSVIGVTSNIPGGNADIYCLSLWRIKNNIDLELVSCCPQLEGLYSNAKGHEDPLTTPKVVISPQSKRVAVLDSSGSLGIFDLDKESSTLSITDLSGDYLSQTDDLSNGKRKCLNGITDFTWWSDYILIIAKMSGVVTMIDIITGKKLLEDDSRFCLPVLERVHQCRGCVLLLESTCSEKEHSHASSLHGKDINSQDERLSIRDKFHQFDYNHLSWSLFSFLEKSVEEMYSILIANQQYQDALDFAHHHGLDKDEVFKSQWLRSAQEADAVNLFLSNIKDQAFVLSECVDKVGPTEEAVKSLLSYGLKITDKYRTLASDGCESSKVWDFRTCRLQLLQYKDRLETFIGINMGRFALQEYCKFRTVPLHEAAVRLAESGKIGALNLLFKRHPYSLAPFMLNVLAAIPETVSVQTYGQLLPGRSPPAIISLRESDWVECEETVKFINKLPNDQISSKCIRTEWIIKESSGFFWPSVEQLAIWYRSRVRDIENYSGQLDNCLCMLEFALQKGIVELRPFYESISHLYYLIYSDDSDGGGNSTMNLNDWEQVSAYEKFKMLLDKVKGDKIVERLRARAIPFMLDSASADGMTDSQRQMDQKHTESFLVRWLKEIASDNNLDICLVVIEEGCRDSRFDGIFRDEIETVECALQCIYLCTLVDRWNTMASILSKLPQIKDTDTSIESLEKRVRAAKGHVEAGRLLAYYQVPKPMSFFLEAHSDEKPVKQILRLVLSKFGRRHPGRSDIDWANMWRDMQLLQEKAFPFLDLEYMLIEFSKGLLKAGKFALARNYLKGTATVALPAEKAENLVIQAAREYFFSASSLACTEIWKAKECLNLFPHSNNVKVEADIIDVLTVKLPNLGITLLPMQFRQIRDPMEIINMVITSHSGTYLNVDELIDIGRVLGLRSQDDIAAVREVVAREAAVSGDLQLAFEQCLILAKTGHGSIWDLCAALARGPVLDNVDTSSRKQLLSFSLSHCDEESIGELLLAWKDLDMQSQCENLMMLTGTNPPSFSVQGSSIISLPGQNVQDIVRATESSNTAEGASKDDFELHVANIMKKLSTVAKAPSAGKQNAWENLLRDNGKVLTYAALTLPWLLELSEKEEFGKIKSPILQRKCGELYTSVRTQAVVTILSWLARNDIAPSDDVVASLAKSVMQVPVSEEEDILGCSILLNLGDAFHGVGVIEEQLKARDVYLEVCSIMNIGMVYSSLHNSGVECGSPTKRRKLLLQKFQEKTTPFSSDVMDKMDKIQSTFWREWKTKLEEQKLLTEQSRELEQIIPGVETERFLAGDSMYIENVVFSVIESVKQLKKPSLKEVLKLADTYNLNRTKVLLRYLASCLASEVWENNDIIAEISGYEEELMASAAEVINTISSDVYPAIDGCNKQRLAYVYGILSKCFLHLKGIEVTSLVLHTDMQYTHSLEMPQFYKTLDQECSKLSFIRSLNFKRIAGLGGLNIESFNDEVYSHVDEFSVEALADMVKTLVGIYADPVANGLISWQCVYKYYILRSLSSVVSGIREIAESVDPDNFKKVISELEQSYDCIKMYIRCLSRQDMLDIVKQYYTSSLPPNIHTGRLPDELEWMDCLIYLLKFWIIVTNDVEQVIPCDSPEEKLIKFNLESLSHCLRVLIHLVEEEKISTNQCWGTISDYVHHGLSSFTADVYNICRAMVVSGCQFEAINQVYSGAVARSPESQFSIIEGNLDILETLSHLYVNIVDSFMLEMTDESNNRWILHNLLSSLCKAEGNLENLRNIRCAVWGRLTELAHNMQLKSQVRVYTLELMQSITGRDLKGRSNHLSDIEPWECWDEPDCTVSGSDSINQCVSADGSSRFTSTLVALKSTRLASALSSSIEITPDDLANIDTAVSCFLTLSEAANTHTHFKALQDILEEWEGLFSIGRQEDPDEAVDAENDWGEDWDEGWESFQEEKPLENKGKDYNSMSIHPLHVCWMQILRKLIALAQFRDVFQLIDGSLAKPNVTLLDADEVQSLIQLVVETDSFTALKLALLLPYEAIQLKCLDSFEAVLKQGVSNTIEDRQLFTLLLSSGAMSTIATNSAYGTTFSYICYMAGHFSRLCQESQLSQKGEGTNGIRTIDEKFFILFRAILFPCFISELVKVKQPLLAGIMVSRFMHTHSSLNLVNVAEASLRRYLEGQIQMQKDPDISFKKIGSCIYLEYTVSSLRGRLDTLMQFALSLLSDNGK